MLDHKSNRPDGMVTQNNVNLRTGAGTNFASLGQVHMGNQFRSLNFAAGTDGRVWFQVRMVSGPNSGRTGWIHSSFVVELPW